MTTHNFLDAVKNVASQTEDDSLLGVTVRKLLQEVRALEALDLYNSKENKNQYTIDEMINEVEIAKASNTTKYEDMLGGNLEDAHMRERFQE